MAIEMGMIEQQTIGHCSRESGVLLLASLSGLWKEE